MSDSSHVAPDVPGCFPATDVDRFGCKQMARTLVRALCDLLEIYGAPAPVRRCFSRQAKAHLMVEDPADYLKRSKNFLCGFKATFLGEELPDQSGYSPSGQFRKWIRSRLRSKARVASISLFAALAKAKSGAEPLNAANVYLQCAKAAATLPLPDTSTAEDVRVTVDAIRPLLDELAAHLGKEFESQERSLGDSMWSQFATSTRACLEYPRSMHGQMGYFAKRLWETERMALPGDFLTNQETFPWQTYFKSNYGLPEYYEESRVIERRFESYYPEAEPFTYEYYELRMAFNPVHPSSICGRHVPGARSWEPLTYEFYEENLEVVMSQEDPVYLDLIEEGFDDDGSVLVAADIHYPRTMEAWERVTDWHVSKEHAKCHKSFGCEPHQTPVRVAVVCEPLKVRLVTCAPAVRARKVIWFQRTCHDWMRQIPCFRLLGKAPQATDIKDCVLERTCIGSGMLGNESSDFSGASDGTPELERQQLMEPLIAHLPPWYQEILRSDNGQHKVKFPTKQTMETFYPLPNHGSLPEEWPEIGKGLKGRAVPHVRGTLMGNLSSFIILSLMVAAVAIRTLRDEGDERPFSELLKSFLVNGDDFYAAWRRSVHERFWKNCGQLQFSKSIGKSFFHPWYANINSQSYFMDLENMDLARKVPVLNLGLLVGRKKLAKDPFDPTVVVTELLNGCRSARMEHRAMRKFTGRFKRQMYSILMGRNLFLSVSLGGMGQRKPLHFNRKPGELLKAYSSWGQKITFRQQTIASVILLQRSNLHLVPFGPIWHDRAQSEIKTPLPWDTIGKPSLWETIHRDEYEPEFESYYRLMLRHYHRFGRTVEMVPVRQLRSQRAVLLDVPSIRSHSMLYEIVEEVDGFLQFRGEKVQVTRDTKHLRDSIKCRVPEVFRQLGIGKVELMLAYLSRTIEFQLRDKTRFVGRSVNLFGNAEESRRRPEHVIWDDDQRPMKLGKKLPRFDDLNPPFVRGLRCTTLSGSHGSHTGWDDLDVPFDDDRWGTEYDFPHPGYWGMVPRQLNDLVNAGVIHVLTLHEFIDSSNAFKAGWLVHLGIHPNIYLHRICKRCRITVACNFPGCWFQQPERHHCIPGTPEPLGFWCEPHHQSRDKDPQ